MKRIYIVLGDGSVGKSSLIRSLTGIRTANRVKVRLTTGIDIDIWAWMRSAQEQPMTEIQMIKEIFKESEKDFIYYLLPLRITRNHTCPGYLEYIEALLNRGAIIENIVFLTNTETPSQISSSISPLFIVNSKSNPVNSNANIVRTNWGWL